MLKSCELDISGGAENLPIKLERSEILTRLGNFQYVPCNIPGPETDTKDFGEQIAGCSCDGDTCDVLTGICTCMKYGCCYSADKRLRADILLTEADSKNSVFLECNSLCSCTSLCVNRLVQHGLTVTTEVYETGEKGFGLRALEPLCQGTFVCEYAGEVLTHKEARRRTSLLTDEDANYIFTLREHVTNGVLITYIDPTTLGNLGRFINHSCEPNLVVFPVRVDNMVPKICLFAARDISAREELTYKYGDTNFSADDSGRHGKVCRCGTKSCMGYLPFDSSVLADQ